MEIRHFSVVIFYNERGEVLLQDRRNLGKDTIEWGWFGGGAEGNETPLETAIREIQEEINITLLPDDLLLIGKTTRGNSFLQKILSGNVFCVLWRSEFENDFCVLEGAGHAWVTPDEMRKCSIYETQRVQLSIFEEYLQYKNA